jgi:hypothetical protein
VSRLQVKTTRNGKLKCKKQEVKGEDKKGVLEQEREMYYYFKSVRVCPRYSTARRLSFQHAPSTARAVDPHLLRELVMLLTTQSFHKDICNLVSCGSVCEGDLLTFDLLLQEVMSHFNMLCSVVELRVPGDGNGGLVVHEEGSGGAWGGTQFCE